MFHSSSSPPSMPGELGLVPLMLRNLNVKAAVG